MLNKLRNRLRKILHFFYSAEKLARINGVNLGTGNFINSNFWSTEPYLITVGNNCQITKGVKIFTHGGSMAARVKYPNFDSFGKVVIGDNVYLGTNTLIMPGVKIGNNVMVAAGSVVTNSVPSHVVIGGNPARIICTVDQYIERNLPYDLGTKGLSAQEKKLIILSVDSSKLITKKELVFKQN